MVKKTASYIRWTPDDWDRIGANALQFIDHGADIVSAIYRAQRMCMPAARQRDFAEVKRVHQHSPTPTGLARFITKARALSASELKRLVIPASDYALRESLKTPEPAARPAAEAPAKPDTAFRGTQLPPGAKRKFVTWTPHMEAAVAHVVQRMRDNPKGKKHSLARWFDLAQCEVLPEELRKTQKSLEQEYYKEQLQTRLSRGLSVWPQFVGKPFPWAPEPPPVPAPAPVEAQAPEPAPPPPEPIAPSDIGRTKITHLRERPFPVRAGRVQVDWTQRERAKLALTYDAIDAEGSPPSRVLYFAQQQALPPDRWRVRQSMQDMAYRGYLESLLTEGRRNAWLVKDDDLPDIVAKQRAAIAAHAERDADIAKAEELAAKLEVKAGSSVEAIAAVAFAEPYATWKQDPQAFQAIAEQDAWKAADAPQAPIPLPAPSASLAEASAAFGATLQRGLHLLLEAHAHHVIHTFDAKLTQIAQTAGQSIAAQIAAQIEQGLRQTVVATMAAELGGPVNPPASVLPPAPAAPAVPQAVNSWQEQQAAALLAALDEEPEADPDPVADTPEVRKKLKVDVVGFVNGDHVQQVRRAFNGNTDLAFYAADEKNRFKPHKGRHCIMLIDRIPHALREKFGASKVKPILVKGTPYNVIHAIEELHRSKGIPQ